MKSLYDLALEQLQEEINEATKTPLSDYTTEQLQKELDKRNLERYSDYELKEEIKRRNRVDDDLLAIVKEAEIKAELEEAKIRKKIRELLIDIIYI